MEFSPLVFEIYLGFDAWKLEFSPLTWDLLFSWILDFVALALLISNIDAMSRLASTDILHTLFPIEPREEYFPALGR